jgi:hypothetical protein
MLVRRDGQRPRLIFIGNAPCRVSGRPDDGFLGLHNGPVQQPCTSLLLYPSMKEYNYVIRVGQTSSSLTKFIVNNINVYVSE